MELNLFVLLTCIDNRLLAPLEEDMAVRAGALAAPFRVPATDWRDPRDVADVGGTIDGRPAMLFRGLFNTVVGLWDNKGADVCGVALLDEVVDPNCLVGDLLGDYMLSVYGLSRYPVQSIPAMSAAQDRSSLQG